LFLLSITCEESLVEFSPECEMWFSATFKDRKSVLNTARAVVSQLVGPVESPGGRLGSDKRRKPLPSPKRSPANLSSPIVFSTSPGIRVQGTSPVPTQLSEVLSGWENPCFKFSGVSQQLNLAASPREMFEVQLERSDLQQVTVVGQVDRKILLAVVGANKLVAFDQHAVHERVLLENVQSKLARIDFEPEMRTRNELMTLTPSNFDVLVRFRPQLLPWFRLSVQNHGILVEGTATIEKETLTIDDMLEHVETLSMGGVKTIPKAVHRILAFAACRNAIKFGDLVSKERAAELFRDLAKCDFPFICAHGRQNVVVLTAMGENAK
jgi:DNA mismatch repair ATPase MutL